MYKLQFGVCDSEEPAAVQHVPDQLVWFLRIPGMLPDPYVSVAGRAAAGEA